MTYDLTLVSLFELERPQQPGMKNDDLIYIKRSVQVWGVTVDNQVILEGEAEHLWKKRAPDAEGYFTLKNYKAPNLAITVISSGGLEITGNTILSELFIDYLIWFFTYSG